jgi:hypothetical protein
VPMKYDAVGAKVRISSAIDLGKEVAGRER